MNHVESVFPFNVFDRKWFQSSIMSTKGSTASAGGGSNKRDARTNGAVGKDADEGGKTSLARTSSYVPDATEMRRVFEQFDENKDGVICSKELSRFMDRLGFKMSLDEVQALVKAVDEDCNGFVDFDEFHKLYSSLSGADSDHAAAADEKEQEKDLKSAFSVFDKNNDGFISVEELQLVLKSLGMPEGHSYKKCLQMIQGVDGDGNGKVDFQEFKKLMTSQAFQP